MREMGINSVQFDLPLFKWLTKLWQFLSIYLFNLCNNTYTFYSSSRREAESEVKSTNMFYYHFLSIHFKISTDKWL